MSMGTIGVVTICKDLSGSKSRSFPSFRKVLFTVTRFTRDTSFFFCYTFVCIVYPDPPLPTIYMDLPTFQRCKVYFTLLQLRYT